MKIVMIVAAALAGLFGIGLLVAPAGFYAPIGLVLTPLAATIPQAHGATLVGLAVLNWRARAFSGDPLRAVLLGNLVVQILSLGVAIRIATLGVGTAITPALIIHVTLGTVFAAALVVERRRRIAG